MEDKSIRVDKFKGRSISDEEWVYGYYVKLHDGKKISHWIYTGRAETDCGDWYPEGFEVIPETIEQYVGHSRFKQPEGWEIVCYEQRHNNKENPCKIFSDCETCLLNWKMNGGSKNDT